MLILYRSDKRMVLNKGRTHGKMEYWEPIVPSPQTQTTPISFKPRIRLEPTRISLQLLCTELLEDMEDSMSIRGPRIPIPYPTPNGDFTLLIGDWFKTNHKTLQQTLDSGKSLPFPDGVLINGQAHTTFTGDQGHT
ncbi:hypothetical protein Pint_28125 [Pistacia integerrima]|uniref:Uncharacterized protein n=1 Tax=Pistacia integerrima TaxID=434235 RepID=A0ACC0YTE2_9ROSI|nr:hypothetical protein Pint_28125 [Pistacia integerrima]